MQIVSTGDNLHEIGRQFAQNVKSFFLGKISPICGLLNQPRVIKIKRDCDKGVHFSCPCLPMAGVLPYMHSKSVSKQVKTLFNEGDIRAYILMSCFSWRS